MNYKEMLIYIIIPLGLLFIGWLLKMLYEKHVAIRPRLFLKLGNSLYAQNFLGFGDNRHKLTWRFECTLKNNSKYTAYDVEVIEVAARKSPFIFNTTDVIRELPNNNHIEANQAKAFEIATSFITEPDELLRFTIENGEKIYMPGLKVQNPEKELKPKELDNVKLILKYKNEKGKVFYTKYIKKGKIENNKLRSLKPFFLLSKRFLK